jgi:hypothetical protein
MNNEIVILTPEQNSFNYGTTITVEYKIEKIDINFFSVVFYLNDELVATKSNTKSAFSITPNNGFNTLKAYCVNRNNKKIIDTEIEYSFQCVAENIIKENNVYNLTEYQLPEFIRTDYPQFVEFIKAYYKFLETSNDPNKIIYNLENYRNIDDIPEFVLDKIKQEVMMDFNLNITKDIQTNSNPNHRNLIKNIKEFYDSKGTQNSIKFLFRILYDKEINIEYPRIHIFKPSESIYSRKKILQISLSNIDIIETIKHKTIYQTKIDGTYQVTAEIVNAIVNSIDGNYVAELQLLNINGTFDSNLNTYVKTIIDGAEEIILLYPILINDQIVLTNIEQSLTKTSYLSDSKVIQDSNYYQIFSYNVLSDIPNKKHLPIIKKSVHPAGFKVFGSFESRPKLNFNLNNISGTINGTVAPFIGNYMAYSVSTSLDFTNFPTDTGLVDTDNNPIINYINVYENGYFLGVDGTSKPQDLPIEYSNYIEYVNNFSNLPTEQQQYPPAEEVPPGSEICETCIDPYITAKDSNLANSILGESIFLPPEQIENIGERWVVGKHWNQIFKNNTKDDGTDIGTETVSNLKNFLDFTIEDVIETKTSQSNLDGIECIPPITIIDMYNIEFVFGYCSGIAGSNDEKCAIFAGLALPESHSCLQAEYDLYINNIFVKQISLSNIDGENVIDAFAIKDLPNYKTIVSNIIRASGGKIGCKFAIRLKPRIERAHWTGKFAVIIPAINKTYISPIFKDYGDGDLQRFPPTIYNFFSVCCSCTNTCLSSSSSTSSSSSSKSSSSSCTISGMCTSDDPMSCIECCPCNIYLATSPCSKNAKLVVTRKKGNCCVWECRDVNQ